MKGITFKQKVSLVFFGLFLGLALLELGLRLAGFLILSFQEHRNTLSLKKKGVYRILCLGESTTAGQYPAYLEDILNQSNAGLRFSVIDKGVSGTVTVTIMSSLEESLDKYRPDMVITMMGINDGGPLFYSGNAVYPKIGSLRVYKLFSLIGLHIRAKFKETRLSCAAEKELNSKEEDLKKGIRSSPGDIGNYIALGYFYRETERFFQAEAAFKKAIEVDPKSYKGYEHLGHFYHYMGRFPEAKESFFKALEMNPAADGALVGLGYLYRDQRDYPAAITAFNKAMEVNPHNELLYQGLGNCYLGLGKATQAQECFEEAVENNAGSDKAYADLGHYYMITGQLPKAEQAYKEAIKMNPQNDFAYTHLGYIYNYQERFNEAGEAFGRAIEINPRNDRALGGMGTVYSKLGQPVKAQEYFNKTNEVRGQYCNPITRNNYLKLKHALDKRGIKLVCMQYPMRNPESLKSIFNGQGGVIFVDNEQIFKDAVRKASYSEYFLDMWAGDTGHCTPKGNRLLAQNAADTIIKEVFNK